MEFFHKILAPAGNICLNLGFSPSTKEFFIMKTTRFLFAAVLAALAFTFFACTSDGGDGGTTGDVSSSSDDGSSDRYLCQLLTGCIQATVSTCSAAGGFIVAVCQEQISSSSSAIDVSSSSSVVAEISSSSVEAVDSSSSVEVSSSSIVSSSSSSDYSSSSDEVVKIPFTDERDGKIYKSVVIGTQTWMAENLNYKPDEGNSWCYDDDPANCEIYGRLYDWNTAMAACPDEWHLPSIDDWNVLINYVGGETKGGGKLKAITGWNVYDGTDDYGFSALPGGYKSSWAGLNFTGVGDTGRWWTTYEQDTYYALYLAISYYTDSAGSSNENKNSGLSVRCLMD
jgi:uncharacterized protein (TIGR02145 family)